ncbi:MAG: 2-amino-4-hydroxy-6-hydroxymethyldihydropteridine diphosphokinase [Proteobacteria bacterium]|nr:2-amino-4-hydroxy-6-hydroxymethyldihydropteridine diphosphokinase [Pseudomonadota bacterium]
MNAARPLSERPIDVWMMSTAYLGLGSNINARSNILAGIATLRGTFNNVRFSPAYQTRAVGFDGDDFINLIASIETTLQPLELKQFLNELEEQHGRACNANKFSDRTLDIDILLYDDLYLVSPLLKIPRPEIMTFTHVLKPLADLAPKLLHPVCRKTIAEIWQAHPARGTSFKLINL